MTGQPWYPHAKRVPATKGGVAFTVPLARVVHHITVSGDASSTALFGTSGYWPGWLVRPSGVEQHYPATVGGRALVNAPGGVATNSFGAAQIETINRPGHDLPKPTFDHLVDLLRWFRDVHHIPWTWPNGRPHRAAISAAGVPYDPGGHNRSIDGWRKPGHFGHSQVPENRHWDPAYTDHDWNALLAAMRPPAHVGNDALR